MSAIAILLAVVTLAGAAGQLLVLVTSGDVPTTGGFGFPGYQVLFALSYATVGYLIATRRPEIVIGWSLLVAGVAIGLDGLAHAYALRSANGAPLPGEAAAVWLDAWLWAVNTGALLFAVFRFPDGRPVGPSWRWIERIALALVAVGLVLSAFVPGPTLSSGLADPLGLPALAAIPPTATNAPGIPGTILAVASLVMRFRRARGLERQQLKWLVAAMLFVTAVAAVMIALQQLLPELPTFAFTALAIVTPLIPISIGVAILRYRLYEIDVIIRRTLVYGALSVVLLVTYVVLVAVVQAALRPFTAGSELAVAASTLATLALVQPLRRCLRDAVDRRFYRSRYDAARTLDAFTVRLRSEVELEAVSRDLLVTVEDTLRPAHAGVWLREAR